MDFLETDPNVIMETLTERSAEIEDIIDLGKDFDHVVVGEILEINAHPNADKVRITKIDVGDGVIRQIICGAKNIAVGQKVPVALPGAVLPGDFRIEKREMRGIASEGMLCSGKELGIADDAQGIYILDEKSLLGQPLAQTLGFDSQVLDVENTAITNRPDLFSHLGFAREMVATGLATWKRKEFDFTEISALIPVAPLPIVFNVLNPELCSARAEIVVDNLQVAPAPEWLQQRLLACGIRPINNIVDVSNYVMLELGIPLHTFDLDKIAGNTITMRESTAGEKIVTLDGITRTLPKGVIIQEDAQKVFDLAGIMGGENSEISANTKRILIHVPVYEPIRIRKAMLALAHRTDAATIYEKRVPDAMTLPGLLRTLQLLKAMCPTMRIVSGIEHILNTSETERAIELKKTAVDRVIGTELPVATIRTILESLDFRIANETDEGLRITVPAHRLADITLPEDLIEEICRIFGLNTIAPAAPVVPMQSASFPALNLLKRTIADFLTGKGFYENLTFSFLGPDLLTKCGIVTDDSYIIVDNPMSVDMSVMRQSLIPRLLEKAEGNSRNRKTFRLFEIGKTFVRVSAQAIQEEEKLTGLLVGDELLTAKGYLEGLYHRLDIPYRLVNITNPPPFAARGTDILVGNLMAGKLFEIKSSIADAFELPKTTAIVIKLDILLAAFRPGKRKIKPAPKFPASDLDLSVLADMSVYAGDVLKVVNKIDPLLESAEILEIFSGKDLPEGKKSITIHLRFRAPDRTLQSAEIDVVKEKILSALQKNGFPFRF